MNQNFAMAAALLALALVTSGCLEKNVSDSGAGPAAAPATAQASSVTTSCAPDPASNAGLFAAPPTDIANIASIFPLQRLDPANGFVTPRGSLRLEYTTPNGGGGIAYPVYAMAPGSIYLILRTTVQGQADPNFEIYINHTCNVSSYVREIHALSPLVLAQLVSTPWQDLSGNGTGPWAVFFGQADSLPVIPVNAGDELGVTKNYEDGFEVGVVDNRVVSGTFVNPDDKRYPSQVDELSTYANMTENLAEYPFLGNQRINAGCLTDYLTDDGTKAAWSALYSSTTQNCGAVGWDVDGTLQGIWFNPANAADALSVIPDDIDPVNNLQIAWGPTVSQLSAPFKVTLENASQVQTGTTVCYDLTNNSFVLFNLSDAHTLNVKYDPTTHGAAQCPLLAGNLPPVDPSWITFIR